MSAPSIGRVVHLRRLQVQRAYGLASAHGHWWARLTESAPESWGDVDASVEAALSVAGDDEWIGILPERGQDGAIYHQTGTGRLAWRVCEDGTVVFNVNRPDGLVIQISVTPSAFVEIHRWDTARVAGRHLATLLDALRAIGIGNGSSEWCWAQNEGIGPQCLAYGLWLDGVAS